MPTPLGGYRMVVRWSLPDARCVRTVDAEGRVGFQIKVGAVSYGRNEVSIMDAWRELAEGISRYGSAECFRKEG